MNPDNLFFHTSYSYKNYIIIAKDRTEAIKKLLKQLDIKDKYNIIYKYRYNEQKYNCHICNKLMEYESCKEHYMSHDEESIISCVSLHEDHLFYDFKLIQ